jgi:hypothetical protein
MKPLSSDTDPQVERIHIEMLRSAPLRHRVQMVTSLIRTTRTLCWQGICKRYPRETPESLRHRFVLLFYGDESVADQVVHLMRRKDTGDMKQPDIIEVVLKIIRTFEKLDIAYHIGGSLASSAFGIARSTLDVDIVADIRPDQTEDIYENLREEFYIDQDMINSAIRRESSFNIIHLETLFKVDVFLLRRHPFDREAFSRRIPRTLSEGIPQPVFFATPEDTVLQKLTWYKAGGQASERQWNDVLGVLKVQGEALDMAYLDRWAMDLGISELLKTAIDESGISD